MKNKILFIISFIVAIALLILILSSLNIEKPIGGDKDEHGCLIAAGYTWNEEIGLCVRQWEIKNKSFSPIECTEQGGRTQNIVAGDYCYENETNIGMVVGFISPNVCCMPNNYCKDPRPEFCYEIYAPVCGFGNFGKQTFSNDCFVCMDSKVDYFINGEC